MAQRHDIVTINFQANARGANKALEALRSECERCNDNVTKLKEQLKGEIKANMPADKIEDTRSKLNAATKTARQFTNAYKDLTKGMATLDKGIEAFNNGSLNQMSAAFQKAVFNAAKLTRLRLDPLSETYKRDKAELTALMDASQQYYARLQADSAQVIKTIKEGGKVSRQAINDELTAHRELLQVLSEDDAGYQRTIRNIAILEQRQREMGGNYAYIRQNLKDTKKVSDETLRSMYAELEKTNQEGKVTQDIIRQNAAAMREIRAEQGRRVQNVLGGDLSKQSEGSIRSAIANAKELIQIYGSTSKKAQELAAQIVNAEEHLKTTGVEGERAARKQAEAMKLLADKHKMMQDRVKNLSSLSAGALTETQKYWQAQMDSATKTSRAYKEAEKNLKLIAAEQERLNKAQLQASANKLGRKNLATLSEQELTASIAAAKQLAASMKPTDAAYKQLVDDIVRAEEHVKQFGLEGQRSARQTADQMKVMEDRMKNVKTLSNSALEETRRFWQAQMDGAQRGSQAYKQAEANLKQLTAEQQRLVNEQNKTQANQLMRRGNLSTMSEGSIRQAIEAAKQYQQTLSTTDPVYQRLTKAIVNAEEHLKKYGLEAERAARKEIEAAKKAADERKKTDKMMHDQLKQGTALSDSALKAQQQYWQRLIDDPKTAATSLKKYEAELQKVKQIQDQLVQSRGKDALAFFRGDTSNASASQLQEQAKALKAYRDSLPQKTHATAIAEIDEILKKVGMTAQKAAAETMSFKQAMQVSAQAGKGKFKGTVEQLTQAKKVLEEMSAKAVKGGLAWRRMQEALQRIELELKNVGHLSKEVQTVLDAPKGKSFNALKQAVEQGRAALNNMDRTTKEGQMQFDELAKKIKAADFEMKQLAGTAKGSATAFDKAWSRLKTYITLYMGAAVAIQKITAAFGDMLELSDRMGEVRKTTGFTADEVGRLSDNLAKLDTRTSLTGLMEFSSLAGSIGLKTQEAVQGFTEAANMIAVSLPEMGNEASRTLMKIADATGDLEKNGGNVRETLERVGSTIIALRANSAAAAGPITDFVSRVGAVGAQAGISIDQIAALGATVDALGGRVEMSATALSRMIPAIKNNSFAVAQALQIPESQLKAMNGMDQMVAVFRKLHDSVKGFDTSTEDGMNAMADSVEKALGRSTSMQEVMKQLNQQGARAGIVFGLLSQNVDKLEEQLNTASNAYEENIALMDEYNKMNDTTAAKWEKLKNQIEEFFVSDSNQRFLGGVIDTLRLLVNILTWNVGPALRLVSGLLHTFIAYWTVLKLGLGEAIFIKAADGFKAMGNGLTGLISKTQAYIKYSILLKRAQDEEAKAAIQARIANEGLNKSVLANVWVAAAAAVVALGIAMYKWTQQMNRTANALAEAEANLTSTTREAGMLFSKYSQLIKKQDELKQSTNSLKEREAKLKEETEELRKKMGDGAEQSDKFKKKQEDLAKAHDEVTNAEKETTKARGETLKLVNEINSKYSTYLGYMLSEASTAETVASAHDLIIAALKEEMYWREQNNAFQTVTEQHSEDLKSYRESSLAELNGMDAMRQQNIMSSWQAMMSSVTYDAKQGGFVIPGAEKAFKSIDAAMEVMKDRFKTVLVNEGGFYMVNPADTQKKLNDLWGESGAAGWGSWTGWSDRGFKDWTRESLEVLQETALLQNMSGSAASKAHESAIEQAKSNTDALIGQAQKSDASNRQIAEAIVGIQKNISKYGEIASSYRQFAADTSLKGIANVLLKDLPEDTRKAVESEIERVAANGITNTPPKTTKESNPYGDYNKVTSPYSEWNGDDLVKRRKEMLERVKALANGADVQAVLSEDAKFISEAVRKNIKTTEQAIEWYNEERLKIQDALHAKHLTNTGDWLDPKKGAKRAKRVVLDDMKYYMDELDAYYTERKAKIQEEQNDEQISEAEARNRTLANEAEWRQRRAELQQLYAKKSEKVTKEEQDAIFDILSDRTGESIGYIQKDIAQTVKFIEAVGTKNKAAMDRIFGDLDKDIETDFLRQRNAIGKHMKAIEDIINKENPFNGIVENLRKNLGTMDVLLTDIEKEEERTVDKEIERTMFIMEQATKGYSLTWEEMMREMAERGWQAWADAINSDTALQTGLMHQVTKAYEAVQDAIKKEAAELKKQADIMWSNILLPGGDGRTTIKDAFEQTIGTIDILEGKVSRANSLIGAGQASERVADKLAIQQMKVQLAMQQYQYDLMRKQGQEKIAALKKEAEMQKSLGDMEKARSLEMQAQNAAMALNLATRKEQTEVLKQQEAIIAKTEESEARFYKELRDWADLLTSSLQSVFEANAAGSEEYYNELAKLNLTGKGGPGAGTYVIIDNAGTSDATAHYEYLDERQALEREREIERENAVAEAWEKMWDDLNMKLSETITDQLNAMLQNQSIDANTQATLQNTEALMGLNETIGTGRTAIGTELPSTGLETKVTGTEQTAIGTELPSTGRIGEQPGLSAEDIQEWKDALGDNPMDLWMQQSNLATQNMIDNNKKIQQSTQTTFAKMTLAANMYGAAYQAMSNDNLSTTQKFEMMALQAVGNYAIGALTTEMASASAKAATDSPGVLGTLWKQLGWAAAPVFAIFTGLLGGLMGLATSKVGKAKSTIAQATGTSVGAGRLATGMLTYSEGNVNEFTDPKSLTPGRSYNVDAADGNTYRARYMGANPKTHITNGPEFHLVGEKGREAIIDAHTTRLMQTDDTGIWQAIQTLYNGRTLNAFRRRTAGHRGVRAFADGNLEDFDDMIDGGSAENTGLGGIGMEQMAAFQASLDRNSAIMERLAEDGIEAFVSPYGKRGIVNGYDTYKKEAKRHGEKHL